MEIRSFETTYNLSEEGHINGRAICFNSISNVLYDSDSKKFFREIIKPEAITQALIDNSDIRMLLNHNKDQMLARNNKGRGSLKVMLNDEGVDFDFSIPNTTLGHDTAELIRREDVVGCSFAFTDTDCTWDFSDRSMPLRIVNNITGLYDLSIVFSPAYDQTSVSARSIEEAEKEAVEEAKEAEEDSTEKADQTESVEEVPQEEVKEQEQEEQQIKEEDRSEDTSYIEDLKPYKEILNTL